MMELIIWGVLSIPLVIISRRSLTNVKCHGFYRFFGWECILWLIINNYKHWFENPFGFYQIISWIVLIYSLFLIIPGVILMKRIGKPGRVREDHTLYTFEKTTELIETGVYKYIRHPLYGSLLFLSWGICFKNPSLSMVIVTIFSTIFFYITGRVEELENIDYFGDGYRNYMKKSKMFVPHLL
jgi:protein-S-isoprenylcysteine O-methyltransferase Ste14